GAVLANAPPFFLMPSVAGRYLEFVVGIVRSTRFLRIEQREVLADRLGCGVPLYVLRSPVPAQNAAMRIQREDRVVVRALHQQAQESIPVCRGRLSVSWQLVVLVFLACACRRDGCLAPPDHHLRSGDRNEMVHQAMDVTSPRSPALVRRPDSRGVERA